ncbi:hypothetical protein [uncultured Eudoraea sp.]|uniref:hypothetical protein n=1 Tax=uncultured Eudoraea sp. TaxID=1035614 RepID=UPI002617107D|nr:hypothetical protein [uncultured Eudoraea sp.]
MSKEFQNLLKGLPIILALFLVHNTNAQFVPKNDVEKQAAKLVQAYQPDVGMTVEQASSVYEKIAEILAKENAVRSSSASPEEKKKSLMQLSKEETEHIGTILEPKQFKEYKKLKKTLQPVRL